MKIVAILMVINTCFSFISINVRVPYIIIVYIAAVYNLLKVNQPEDL